MNHTPLHTTMHTQSWGLTARTSVYASSAALCFPSRKLHRFDEHSRSAHTHTHTHTLQCHTPHIPPHTHTHTHHHHHHTRLPYRDRATCLIARGSFWLSLVALWNASREAWMLPSWRSIRPAPPQRELEHP